MCVCVCVCVCVCELQVDHFESLTRVLTRDDYSRSEMKSHIAMASEAFNIVYIHNSRQNDEIRKILGMCYIWSIALYCLDTRDKENWSENI